MKFSLKAIFAILTLACLGALVYQQEIKKQQLHERQIELRKEIESLNPHLENDLPFLRVAAASNSAFESLNLQASKSLDLVNGKFGEEASQAPDQVSVAHLPNLDSSRKSFLIYVPDSKNVTLQIFVSSLLFGGDIEKAKSESPFKLSQNVNLKLPNGLSRLDLRPADNNAEEWHFILNENVICRANSKESGLSGQQMIWLLSTLKGIGSFRHHNIHRRVRHACSPNDQELEFASFVSSDYMSAVRLGIQPSTVSKLKCSLVIGPIRTADK